MKKYNKGFIELEEVNCSEGLTATMPGSVKILNGNVVEIEGKKYIAKRTGFDCYSELLAGEMAHDLDLPCANYDIAFFNEGSYLITEALDNNTALVSEAVSKVYHTDDIAKYNSIDDIKTALGIYYKGCSFHKVTEDLKNIYLFDILTANPCRSAENMTVFIDGFDEIRLGPVFDNSKCFTDEEALLDSNYGLGVEHDRKYGSDLVDFLKYYPDMIKELEAKLVLLNPANIQHYFDNISVKIDSEVPDHIVKKYINAAMDNQAVIKKTIATLDQKSKNKIIA